MLTPGEKENVSPHTGSGSREGTQPEDKGGVVCAAAAAGYLLQRVGCGL